MAEKHHDADKPLVGQVGEQDQKSRERVVQDILIIISLLPDEHMREKPGRMLPELQEIKNLHLRSRFRQERGIEELIGAGSISTQPCGEKSRVFKKIDRSDRAYEVVDQRISPFDQSVRSLGSSFPLILFLGQIIFLTQSIKNLMDSKVECLNKKVKYSE